MRLIRTFRSRLFLKILLEFLWSIIYVESDIFKDKIMLVVSIVAIVHRRPLKKSHLSIRPFRCRE